MQVTLTGKMGVRTKHQTKETAQLVVDVVSRDTARQAGGALPEGQVPSDVPLDDDQIHGKPVFKAAEDAPAGESSGGSDHTTSLHPCDQCLVLSLCLNVKNKNPRHGITQEEMLPYTERVVENPNNWLVHSMALLLRSRLQSDKSKTVERSAMQIQVLSDQYAKDYDNTAPGVRMRWFYQV